MARTQKSSTERPDNAGLYTCIHTLGSKGWELRREIGQGAGAIRLDAGTAPIRHRAATTAAKPTSTTQGLTADKRGRGTIRIGRHLRMTNCTLAGYDNALNWAKILLKEDSTAAYDMVRNTIEAHHPDGQKAFERSAIPRIEEINAIVEVVRTRYPEAVGRELVGVPTTSMGLKHSTHFCRLEGNCPFHATTNEAHGAGTGRKCVSSHNGLLPVSGSGRGRNPQNLTQRGKRTTKYRSSKRNTASIQWNRSNRDHQVTSKNAKRTSHAVPRHIGIQRYTAGAGTGGTEQSP